MKIETMTVYTNPSGITLAQAGMIFYGSLVRTVVHDTPIEVPKIKIKENEHPKEGLLITDGLYTQIVSVEPFPFLQYNTAYNITNLS